MSSTVRVLTPLTVFFLLSACHSPPQSAVGGALSPRIDSALPPAPAAALAPSPHLLVGRVLAVDVLLHFAIIDVAASAPLAALADQRELLTRTDNLRVTARLLTTSQLRGRTLGTIITAGAPNLGDEVVFLAAP